MSKFLSPNREGRWGTTSAPTKGRLGHSNCMLNVPNVHLFCLFVCLVGSNFPEMLKIKALDHDLFALQMCRDLHFFF